MAVNKVILLGNVGRDPDVRHMDGGSVCATFPLATTERGYRTKNNAEIPEKTEWHNVVAWQGIAERIERQVRKGCLVYIEGKLRTRNWTDQNNNKHYITEIFADQFELLRPSSNAHNNNEADYYSNMNNKDNDSTQNDMNEEA